MTTALVNVAASPLQCALHTLPPPTQHLTLAIELCATSVEGVGEKVELGSGEMGEIKVNLDGDGKEKSTFGIFCNGQSA